MTHDSKEYARLQKIRANASQVAVELLLLQGLYGSIEVKDEDQIARTAERLIREGDIGTYDCFCTGCKKETPFIVKPIDLETKGGRLRGGDALTNAFAPNVIAIRAVCQRDLTTYLYAFHKAGTRLIKIGQHPSMADIAFGELKDIDKTLEPMDRKELGKAIGLFSHDAASGAFVYLRRVFERMIRRAHDRQTERRGAAVEGFDGMRVDEKIAALKDELPERVVKNSAVFSVLSAGIHELDDDECKKLFPVLKAVIFQMLEQEEHKRRREIAERETDAAFQALLTTTGKTDEEVSSEQELGA